jgi:hypothetical protein
MPQIPTYDDKVQAQGGLNVQASPASFGEQTGEALVKGGAALEAVAEPIYRAYNDQETIQAYSDQAKMIVGQKQAFDEKVKGLDPNAPDYQDQINKLTTAADAAYQEAGQDLVAGAQTRTAAKKLAGYVARNAPALHQYFATEQARLSSENTLSNLNQTIKLKTDEIAANPSNDNTKQIIDEFTDTAGKMESLEPDKKQKAIDVGKHDFGLVQVQSYFARNGKDALAMVGAGGGQITAGGRVKGAVPGAVTGSGQGSTADFDSIITDIIGREGGPTVVENDGGTGAPAKYGINQAKNPTVDVRNLTEAKAREIYRSEYWDKINADQIAPGMRATAVDAAVNQGVEWTKQALTEAGGDVDKFNQLREARYHAVAASDPDKAQFLPQWLSRLEAVKTGGGGAGAPMLPQVQPLSDEQIVSAKPALEGWQYLDWKEKVAVVRSTEATLGGNLAQERGQLERDLSDLKSMSETGKEFPGFNDGRFSEANLTQKFGPQLGPTLAKAAAYEMNVTQFMKVAQTMPFQQASETLKGLEPQPGPGYAVRNEVFQHATEALKRIQAARDTDPIGWAASALPAYKPLDVTSADTFKDSVHERLPLAKSMRTDYDEWDSGIFSKDEVARIGDFLERANPQTQVAYMKAIRLGTAGDDDEFTRAMGEISTKSPMFAFAADLAIRDGVVHTAAGDQDAGTVAKQITEGSWVLQGHDLGDPTKSGKPLDINYTMYRQMFNDMTAGTFNFPDAQRAGKMAANTFQATLAYMVADYYHRGGDLKLMTSDDVANAVQAVTGGIAQNNKGDKLFIPWGMDRDKFADELPIRQKMAIDEAGLKGTPLDASDAYHLVNVGDGKYGMTWKGEFLKGTNGRNVIIDYAKPIPSEYQPKPGLFDISYEGANRFIGAATLSAPGVQ